MLSIVVNAKDQASIVPDNGTLVLDIKVHFSHKAGFAKIGEPVKVEIYRNAGAPSEFAIYATIVNITTNKHYKLVRVREISKSLLQQFEESCE